MPTSTLPLERLGLCLGDCFTVPFALSQNDNETRCMVVDERVEYLLETVKGLVSAFCEETFDPAAALSILNLKMNGGDASNTICIDSLNDSRSSTASFISKAVTVEQNVGPTSCSFQAPSRSRITGTLPLVSASKPLQFQWDWVSDILVVRQLAAGAEGVPQLQVLLDWISGASGICEPVVQFEIDALAKICLASEIREMRLNAIGAVLEIGGTTCCHHGSIFGLITRWCKGALLFC